MQNFQQKAKEVSTDKQVQKKDEQQQIAVYKCSNCGATFSDTDKFCAECGMGLKGNSCVFCGEATQPNHEICHSCGQNLLTELCSFCGGKMTPDEAFCSDCGNPRTGIICSCCNTLNFRSFCRKCNSPLNELAYEALEEARKDQKVYKAVAIAQELVELEQLLNDLSGCEAADRVETNINEIPEISEENRELLNQYKDLLTTFRQHDGRGGACPHPDETVHFPNPNQNPRKVFQ